jgi:hypothetical protein
MYDELVFWIFGVKTPPRTSPPPATDRRAGPPLRYSGRALHDRCIARQRPVSSRAMKKTGILWVIVFLLCLTAFPVISYLGGRACMRLWVPPLLPAEIVPAGIGLLAGIMLVVAVVRSFVARRDRTWTMGALAVAIVAAGAFVSYSSRLPGFLHGLRDRFATRVGYAKMREFAAEVSQLGEEVIITKPGKWSPPTPEQQEQWDDLVVRYPFVKWTFGQGVIVARGGIVGMSWGSPLTGHWGFQVAPGGKVKDMKKEDRCRFLRVAEDIQFVYYSD